MNIILIWFAIKYKGDWDAIYKALEEKEKISLKELQKLEKRIKEEKIQAITILDLEYPIQLKKAYKPPFVIFYDGNIKIFKEIFLCATGNEVNNKIRKNITDSIKEIIPSYALVSSLYKGVDELVFSQVKSYNGKILFVAADALDKPFFATKINTTNNIMIISEYPPGTHINKQRLRARNRIIASFGESLILYSSLKNGGIMNLVTNFLNQGKDIFCFPGEVDGKDGNSDLIKQGASLITSIKEIGN